ncbi:hypothetical protein AURDEDRAFT_111721 [Auricularia subglabra TFB-10046 SS5]|nr:hypothetical protein AURDEDRAFT_111721 [Auricularia subglabra TFB-10046 SS5]
MSLLSMSERQRLRTALHVAIQGITDRDPSEQAVQGAIDEIRAIVDEAFSAVQRDLLGIKNEPYPHQIPGPGPVAPPPAPINGVGHQPLQITNGASQSHAMQLQLLSPTGTHLGDRDRDRDRERQPTVDDREDGEWSRQQTPRSVTGTNGNPSAYAAAHTQQLMSPALAQRVMALAAGPASTSDHMEQHQQLSAPFQIAPATYTPAPPVQVYAPPQAPVKPVYAPAHPVQNQSYIQVSDSRLVPAPAPAPTMQDHSYMRPAEARPGPASVAQNHSYTHVSNSRPAPSSAPIHAPTPVHAVPPPMVQVQQPPQFTGRPIVLRLPKDQLITVFRHLLPPARHTSRGRFTNLILASGVCKQWRETALEPSLWTILSSLTVGEMEQLETLLSRSNPANVRLVSLHFVTPRKFQFASVCAALARGVPRILRMELSMNEKQAPVLNALRAALIRARAPLLEHFSLDYPVRLVLSSQLFDRHAPRLASFSCLFGQLPNWTAQGSTAICDAMRNVRAFEALDVDRPPDERDARRLLLELCPRLERLVLPIPLHNANAARWEPPVLRFLQVGEARDREGEKGMVPTLALLRHREVATVHVVAPRGDTQNYVMQRRTAVHAAALWGEHAGQLVFRDTVGHLRVFSRIAPASVGAGLRGHVLSSLAIGSWAGTADWAELFAADLRNVTTLTILLVAPSSARVSSLVHVFAYSSNSRWLLPMLSTLRIVPALTEPGVDLEPRIASAFEVGATDVLRFVTATVTFDALLLPEVVLSSGARFRDRFTGPEVETLRRHVGTLRLLA